MNIDKNATKRKIETHLGPVSYYSLPVLESAGVTGISSMPVSVKILLESVLRQLDGENVTEAHVKNIAEWKSNPGGELPFKPARVIMQDFTGVPGIVDLAAMRDAISDLGGDPKAINPLIPVDLVIDHSVQVDQFGSNEALFFNAEKEFARNRERYEFLHWAANSFDNLSVVPPATGIVHQVNLEYLSKVVQTSTEHDESLVYPDTLVGTDSHTTMVNALGVLGWGVGGIEAEAALLGQPLYIRMPEVVGFRLEGKLAAGVTATDLVLKVTETLRKLGVVGKFVEFFGPGLDNLSLPDRATISNMCPEYGATAALFPIDLRTLEFLKTTGRSAGLVDLVEKYAKEQGLFRSVETGDPEFSQVVSLDIAEVEASVAGPKRPQDRSNLSEARGGFRKLLESEDATRGGENGKHSVTLSLDDGESSVGDGSVVIAAITSCTNTSNPSVMIAAGLLAKRAVEQGLSVPTHVKTSLAPGSRVVKRYLDLAGLTPYLDKLGFNLVGFGCTTCIGNSGPLRSEISRAIVDNDIVGVSVLSGNRNFEGRIHPEVKANYLASPPLVVAYALAGDFDIDLKSDPLGRNRGGKEVYLSDIWPDQEEIASIVDEKVRPELFREEYADVYTGNEEWNGIEASDEDRYNWSSDSTYIKQPPFFIGLSRQAEPNENVEGARVLALLGDSVTTDHISPAGVISYDGPAAQWLVEQGVAKSEFNSFGSRRGNHEIMMRGTLANIRIRNRLVPPREGGFTVLLPEEREMTIYEASVEYRKRATPLIIIAGKDYGMGSSRDWAAKGVALLGVRAVIAESYERIHRSNLIGMGVLPLEFTDGMSAENLGLTGKEVYDIEPVDSVSQVIRVKATADGERQFDVRIRIDTAVEMVYYRNGGILQTVLRQMVK